MQRSFVIDVLKTVASLVIVLHHFSVYGPLAEVLRQHWPGAVTFMFEYGRMAVQVFLVVGGFLAARSLERKTVSEPLSLVGMRFARLVPVYAVALAWVCAAVALSREAIDADWLPESPSALQVITHLFLLQGVLGQSALSSGVWYVAIDLQLYAMLVFVFAAFGRPGRPATARLTVSGVVLAACALSLLIFNRNAALDDWGIYFLGSYGLGVLAAWARRGRGDAAFFLVALVLALAAYLLEPRTRLALAGSIALLLAVAADAGAPARLGAVVWARLADSSYALFLAHFGVIVLVSAAWNLLDASAYPAAVSTLFAAFLACVALGVFLHRWVEGPATRGVVSAARWVRRLAVDAR